MSKFKKYWLDKSIGDEINFDMKIIRLNSDKIGAIQAGNWARAEDIQREIDNLKSKKKGIKKQISFTKSEENSIKKELFKSLIRKQNNPFAICTSALGEQHTDKWERCVLHLKEKFGIEKAVSDDIAYALLKDGKVDELRVKLVRDEGMSREEANTYIANLRRNIKEKSHAEEHIDEWMKDEVEGAEEYHEAAEETSNEEVAEILEEMAEDEERHQENIEEIEELEGTKKKVKKASDSEKRAIVRLAVKEAHEKESIRAAEQYVRRYRLTAAEVNEIMDAVEDEVGRHATNTWDGL